MKTLCVRSPYSELIARGRKKHEIRTWYTSYRGPLLIVASSQYAHGASKLFGDRRMKLTRDQAPRSTAVCVVDLVEIREVEGQGYLDSAFCDVDESYLAWVLANPRRVKPFFVSGKLNLFEVADSQVELAK